MRLMKKNSAEFFNKPQMLQQFVQILQRDEQYYNPIKMFTDHASKNPDTIKALMAL